MYEEHLKSCEYCSKGSMISKPKITVKGASSYYRQKKLTELGAIIKGTSYAGLSPWLQPQTKTRGASEVTRKLGPIEREVKLRELGKMIKSFVG